MRATFDDQWEEALALVRNKISNDLQYGHWITPLEICSRSNGTIELGVSDALFAEWFESEGYAKILRESLHEVTGLDFAFDYKVLGANGETHEDSNEGQLEFELAPTGSSKQSPRPSLASPGSGVSFIEDYRFESFVKGDSNKLAYAASAAVADKPGKTYNPLFVYGGAGLGKTHLLHAIGNEMMARNPQMRVLYVTSEIFFNDLVESIRRNRMHVFRERYRDACDALLIDDVQFFARKGHTQDEFFHTFNALHAANKQIVFTSDRFPEEIENLEERLRSRFQWGLTTDIKPPVIETRIAILAKKAELRGLDLPDDVAFFIASRIRSNVRRLEGALTSLAAYTSLHNVPINKEVAKKALREFLPGEERPVTAEQIIKLVATHYHIKPQDMKGQGRQRQVTRPRQVAMYLTRRFTTLSFPEIGARFGNRDHTTVMSAVRKVETLIDQEDMETKRAVEVLSRQLES